MDFNSKVAIVTGAAQGIGLEIAGRLADDGAALALVDLNASGLAEAEAKLQADGRELGTFAVDLTDAVQVQALPERVASRFGRIDILINNAGIRDITAFADTSLASWQRVLDTNLTAPFLLIQSVLPYFLAQGGGKIVNITSTAAELGFKNRVGYNVSKAALAMLTKSVALELGGQGIRCNAVAPGVIETPLNHDYFADPELTRTIVDSTPNGGWGVPSDIAASVAFLASDETNYINGATLLVDGGWSTGKGY
jgi:NAD(P)-dependent dehydrogenase (short-subunit alcohol dehydrogenase family)